MSTNTRVFNKKDVRKPLGSDQQIAVIGYGNQGRAQALNLRDSGCSVVIGNRDDRYRKQVEADKFTLLDIGEAVSNSSIILILVPDEVIPELYRSQIEPNLEAGSMLVFASGYALAFDRFRIEADVDITLLAPRMIGVGVRERYLTKEGFFCLVGIERDTTGRALERLLTLTFAVSGLYKPAIEVSFKQEAILDLFNEQAFGPAFGRVLLSAIHVLLEKGLPPEAVLVELYMSEEMSFVYRTMAQVGLVGQLRFHSETSQYGAMSRGARFLNPGLKGKMARIYDEIESGDFAREWKKPISRLKLKALRFFAARQKINAVEKKVRSRLGLEDASQPDHDPEEVHKIMQDESIARELEELSKGFKD